MSEYLRNLGEIQGKSGQEDRRKNKDVAIEAIATQQDASGFFNSVVDSGKATVNVSDFMRRKGQEADVASIIEADDLAPEQKLEQIKQKTDPSVERSPVQENNDLDSGIVSNALGVFVPPSQIKAEREGNLKLFTSELEKARDEAIARFGEKLAGKVDGISGTGAKVGLGVQIGVDLFVGSGHNEVYNSIKTVLPDGGAGLEGNRFTNFSGAVKALRDYVGGLEPKDAEKVVRDFITDLAGRSGTIQGRDYAFDNNVRTILANMDGADNVTDALNGVIAAAELIGVGSAVSSVVKAPLKVAAGSTAKYVAKGAEGARSLARAAASREGDKVLAAVDTDPAAVVSELSLPKLEGQAVEFGARYVDPDFLDPGVVADNIASEVGSVESYIGSVLPKNKLNDTILEPTEDGIKVSTLVGGVDGNGYKTKASATRLANKLGEGAEVVEQNGKWYARYSSDLSVTSGDIKQFVVSESVNGRAWRGLFGRNAQFNGVFNKMASEAEFVGVKADKEAREILKPYTTLKKSQQDKVHLAIRDGDKNRVWYEDSELVAKYGLDKAERDAYYSYKKLAERALELENARVYNQLINEGFRGLKVGELDRVVRPIQGPNGAKQVLDLDGKVVATPDVNTHDFYLLPGESASRGKIVDIVAVPKGTILGMPPRRPVKAIDGYLGRNYDRPAFVAVKKKVTRNGVEETITETVASARSLKQALDAAKTMTDEITDDSVIEYVARSADEVVGDGINPDYLDKLIREGRLVNQGRKSKPLDDVDGGYTAPSVDEMMGKMVNGISTNAGIGKFIDIAIDQLNKNYGDLGFKGIGKIPEKPSLLRSADDLKRWKEGAQFVRYLQNINGVGAFDNIRTLNHYRQEFAEFFYNDSLRASTRAGAAASKAIGDELSGLGSPISDAVKRATFSAYLLLNPARQALLQATMVPTYAGVHGGLKYISTGKFVKDFAALNGVGKKTAEQAELARRFQSSGLGPLVDQHIFDLGKAAESGIKAGSIAGKFMNGVKRVGMDIGVGLDKKGAFLFSHNRFKVTKGRTPSSEADWKEIAGFAEQMALNQNRSDTLLTQNGALSVMTQFLSHQFKMTGRIAGLERDFDVSERLKMGAATVMSYGVAGYGLKEVYDNIKAKHNINPPPAADAIIQNGLIGAGFNMVMETAGAPEAALSEGFSPANFLGGYGKALENFINGTLSGSGYTLNPSFAAAGLVGDVAGALTFTGKMLGLTLDGSITPEAAFQTTLPEYVRMFPFGNNLFKAYAAATTNQLVDSKGNPIANTPGGWAAAYALVGLKTQSEQDYRAAISQLYGEYKASSVDGILGAVADEASHQAKLHANIINKAYDGDLTTAEAQRIMELHWDTIVGLNLDHRAAGRYRQSYYKTLDREVRKSGTTAAEKLVSLYMRAFARGEVRNEQNLIDWIEMQEFEGAKELADQLNKSLIGSK